MAPKDDALSRRLPSPGERWVSRRKAMIIAASSDGMITVEKICRVYSSSRDELASWAGSFERHGIAGLRATRVQLYRQVENATAGAASRPDA
jgi:hypothetical protein